MNTVSISDAELTVVPQGMDKLWSFRRELRYPLAHVRGATFDPGIVAEPKGRRSPGLHTPNHVAGTFTADGEATFWNVSDRSKAVVVELADEQLRRLVISVDDPKHVENAINDAVSRRSTG